LVRKFHEAKTPRWSFGVQAPHGGSFSTWTIWPELVSCVEVYDDPYIINLGTGEDLMITKLAETITSVFGFQGALRNDVSKPDGMPRKLLDTSKIGASGWAPTVAPRDGIEQTYCWYLDHLEKAKASASPNR